MEVHSNGAVTLGKDDLGSAPWTKEERAYLEQGFAEAEKVFDERMKHKKWGIKRSVKYYLNKLTLN